MKILTTFISFDKFIIKIYLMIYSLRPKIRDVLGWDTATKTLEKIPTYPYSAVLSHLLRFSSQPWISVLQASWTVGWISILHLKRH